MWKKKKKEVIFGTLALVLGLITLLFGWAIMVFLYDLNCSYIVFVLIALAIVFGILGIVKDDSKRRGIAGLILGIIALVVILSLMGFLIRFKSNLEGFLVLFGVEILILTVVPVIAYVAQKWPL